MAHIATFNNQEGATFIDNSITVNAAQTNTQVNVQPQVAPAAASTAPDTESVATTPAPTSKIIFNGNKTDFVRIINAAVLRHCFQHENGTIATQEEVFAAFDTAFNAGLKNYDRLLNQTKDADPKTNGKIFDTLKNLCLSYAAGEIDAK